MKKILIFFFFFQSLSSQHDDIIKKIFDASLTKSKAYEWLDYLSNQIGGRLSGSINYDRSVKWSKDELELLISSILNFESNLAFSFTLHSFFFLVYIYVR